MKFSLRYLSRTIPFIILCLGAIAASASSQKGVEIQRSDIPAFYLLEPLTGLTDIQQIASQIHQSDPDAQIRQTVIKDSSLGKVVDYIHRYADLLGTQASSHLAFLVDQAFPGSGAEEPHYIRLNQIIMRKDKSFFPIVGAEILVRISPTGQLESLSSSLVPTPQHSKEEFLNFGTIIANSSEDLRRQIFEALVENPTDGFKSWVIEVTRRAPQDSKPVPPEFLADPVSFVVASRSNMNHFFSQLGYRALFRMIRDLKQHGQIQYLVQRDLPSHNRQNPNQTYAFYWRFAHPFGSTATIDVEDSPSGFRIARVLKSLPADAAEVNINMYKAGDKFPESGLFSPAESHKFSMRSSQRRNGDDDLDVAANNIAEAVNYFFDVFKWRSYDNRGAEIKVTAKVGHKDLAQNAAWAKSPFNQFIFGKGGDVLANFVSAKDVIGHEYCHAIISSTSRLAQDNQPGALDEHACDVLGMGFEAHGTLKGMIDYQVGESVLTAKGRSGGVTALRDLLNPDRSLRDKSGRTPPKSFEEAQKPYGRYCYSSDTNDHCGRHYQMGVLNYAVALALSDTENSHPDLGINSWDRMSHVFFNVYTKRLRSNSDFQDYRKQLLGECFERAKSQSYPRPHESDCQAFEKRFSQVGIKDPQDVEASPELDDALKSSCKLLKELADKGTGSVPDFCSKYL